MSWVKAAMSRIALIFMPELSKGILASAPITNGDRGIEVMESGRKIGAEDRGVAPWYFEQLATCFRKQKNLPAEVAILQRYSALPQAPWPMAPKLVQHLEKAKANLEASLK